MIDLLRSCYSVDMQFDLDANIIRNVTWFFTEPGAKYMDFPHLFGSDQWSPFVGAPPSPGERWDSPRPWSNGKKPCFLDGKGGFCGEKDWWQDGVPGGTPPVAYGIYGIPSCCPKPLAMPWYDNLGDFTGRAMSFTGQTGVGWSLASDGFGNFSYSDSSGALFIIAESDPTCANPSVPDGFTTLRWFNFNTQVNAFLDLLSYDEATFTGAWRFLHPPAGVPPNLKVTLRIPKVP